MFSGGARTEDAATYKKVFLEIFNAAVTENAPSWNSNEQNSFNHWCRFGHWPL